MIVQELVALQHEHGYLPDDALQALAQRLSVPLYRLQEVASFFPHFRRTPPAKVHVQICRDMSCQLRGAGDVLTQCGKRLAEVNGHDIHVEGVSCLGRCDRAPAAMINEQLFVDRSSDELCAIAKQMAASQTVERDSDAA